MFYGRKIKELEQNLETLTERVQKLAETTSQFAAEVDALLAAYQNQMRHAEEQQAQQKPVQQPKPKYRPKKSNGKGKTADGE